MRYFPGGVRILISSRATSTFGWRLAAGRPFVLLDHPAQAPFRDDPAALLDQALFRSDMGRAGALDALPAGRIMARALTGR